MVFGVIGEDLEDTWPSKVLLLTAKEAPLDTSPPFQKSPLMVELVYLDPSVSIGLDRFSMSDIAGSRTLLRKAMGI